jgi:tetratricopeptide (TPR) repeat protein
MDLAQAASIFKRSRNFKALGICYNNIANVQYKNAQYNEAAANFSKAIAAVEKLLEENQKTLKDMNIKKGK